LGIAGTKNERDVVAMLEEINGANIDAGPVAARAVQDIKLQQVLFLHSDTPQDESQPLRVSISHHLYAP
jgi:hypothetical protein